jgi:hypothetical protein
MAMLTSGGTSAETFMANIDRGLRYLDEGLPL